MHNLSVYVEFLWLSRDLHPHPCIVEHCVAICKSLHYMTIMNCRVCGVLVTKACVGVLGAFFSSEFSGIELAFLLFHCD